MAAPWATAAGILGAIGHLFTIQTPSDEARAAGVAAAVAELGSGPFHIGVVAGLLAVFCLLAFAAGWQRWAAAATPGSLAARLAGLALVASAGAMILGYGIKGMLAVYLPGGSDAGTHGAEGLYVLYIFDDLAPFMAWYGVAMAAAAIAWLGLRERALPLWIGLVSALFAVVPFAFSSRPGCRGSLVWSIPSGSSSSGSAWR